MREAFVIDRSDQTDEAPRAPLGVARGVSALAPASAVRVEVSGLPAPGATAGSGTEADPLVGPRLTLRPLREPDRDAFVAMVRASRALLDQAMPIHLQGESDEALFERQLRLTQRGEADRTARRRVGVLHDGTLVGCFNLVAIRAGLEPSADANWWLHAQHRGRGLAREGVRLLAEHALAPLPGGLGLSCVQAWIVRDNEPSVRLARDLGFSRAGDERTFLRAGERWQLHDLWVLRARPDA